MPADLYETLQVSPNAEQEIIDGAYIRLSKKYHPDVSKTPDATERMKQINVAYEIIRDPIRRAKYDQWRTKKRSTPPRTESTAHTPPPKREPPPEPAPTKPKYSAPPTKPYTTSWGKRWVILIGIVLIIAGLTWLGTLSQTLQTTPAIVSAPNDFLSTIAAATRTYVGLQLTRTAYVPPPATSNIGSASVNISTPAPNNEPYWVKDYVELKQRDMDVCVPNLAINEEPNANSAVVRYTEIGWYWHVFGYVGDWWYLGHDEQNRQMFVPKRSMCEHSQIAGPTQQAITSPEQPRTVSSALDMAALTPMPRQEIPVCAPYGHVYSFPDLRSSVITYIHKDGKFPVDGKIGDWYRGSSTDDKGIPYFHGYIQQQDLCFAPDPAAACDDYIYNRWKNGRSDQYAPPCTPQ